MTLKSQLISVLNSSETCPSDKYGTTPLGNIIDRSYKTLYNTIVPQFPERFEQSGTCTFTSGGTSGVSLPTPGGDYTGGSIWQVLDVEVADSDSPTGYVHIPRANRNNINNEWPKSVTDVREIQYELRGSSIYWYPATLPNSTETARIWYISTCPTDPETVIQTIPGYFEWLFYDVLGFCATDQEQDANRWYSLRKDVETRMVRDMSKPLDGANCVMVRDPWANTKVYPWADSY